MYVCTAVWDVMCLGGGAWPGLAFWQHLRPPAPYRPRSAHPRQGSHWHPPSGMEGTPAWQWRRCRSHLELDRHWSVEPWVYLQSCMLWVNNLKHNIGVLTGKQNDPTHLFCAWAPLALGLVVGRGNRPTGWCQDPSQGLVELEKGTFPEHACGGTCHCTLERERDQSTVQDLHNHFLKSAQTTTGRNWNSGLSRILKNMNTGAFLLLTFGRKYRK